MKSNDSTPSPKIDKTVLEKLIDDVKKDIAYYEDKLIGANMHLEIYTNQLTQLN